MTIQSRMVTMETEETTELVKSETTELVPAGGLVVVETFLPAAPVELPPGPPRRRSACSVCGHTVESGLRGPMREVHKECEPLRDTLTRLKAQLASLPPMTARQLLNVRYELLCMSTEVPRPRDANGRFIRREKK